MVQDKNGTVVCHIRLKPNAICWADKGKHNWKQVSLKDFAAYTDEKGIDAKK